MVLTWNLNLHLIFVVLFLLEEECGPTCCIGLFVPFASWSHVWARMYLFIYEFYKVVDPTWEYKCICLFVSFATLLVPQVWVGVNRGELTTNSNSIRKDVQTDIAWSVWNWIHLVFRKATPFRTRVISAWEFSRPTHMSSHRLAELKPIMQFRCKWSH
jgi:hypothetical protein